MRPDVWEALAAIGLMLGLLWCVCVLTMDGRR